LAQVIAFGVHPLLLSYSVALFQALTLQTRSPSRCARLGSRVWSQFARTGETGR